MCENPEACSAKLHEMQFLCIAKRVIVPLAELLQSPGNDSARSLYLLRRPYECVMPDDIRADKH